MKAITCVFATILVMSLSSSSPAQPPHANQQLQHPDELFQPQMHVNQPLNISIIQGNRVLNRRTIAPNNFTLPMAQNLAVIEEGERLKRLPDTLVLGNATNPQWKKFLLPETYISRLTTGNTVFLQILLICKSNLVINRKDYRFHGKLAFQLINSQNPTGESESLKEPIILKFFSGSLDSIPNQISLDRINSIAQINCSGSEQLSDSADVNIITTIRNEGYKYFLPVNPYLRMNITKASIKGFGLQEALINLIYLGSNKKDSISVSIDATKGSVKSNTQFVKFNAPKEFKIRSENMGQSEITLVSRFDPIKNTLFYSFPWLFLTLSVIGGGLGAWVKARDRDKPTKINIEKIIIGVIIGLVVATAYYVCALNLISISINAAWNEGGIFILSFLGSFLGISKPKTSSINTAAPLNTSSSPTQTNTPSTNTVSNKNTSGNSAQPTT